MKTEIIVVDASETRTEKRIVVEVNEVERGKVVARRTSVGFTFPQPITDEEARARIREELERKGHLGPTSTTRRTSRPDLVGTKI